MDRRMSQILPARRAGNRPSAIHRRTVSPDTRSRRAASLTVSSSMVSPPCDSMRLPHDSFSGSDRQGARGRGIERETGDEERSLWREGPSPLADVACGGGKRLLAPLAVGEAVGGRGGGGFFLEVQ